MLIATLVLMAAASVPQSRQPDPCSGSTTIDINACLGTKLDAANAELARYSQAAVKRIVENQKDASANSQAASALSQFRAGEKAWSAYRDAECEAMYDYWSGGTIRGAMGIGCKIQLTRQRTLVIWQNWLTYMDDRPPILPKPPIGKD